jgi:hypothetical protein
VAVPDGTISERLAGATADPQAVLFALQVSGANPPISGTFRPRG